MPSTHQPTVYVSLFPLVANDWYSYNNDTHDTIVDAINSMNATVYEFDHEPSTRKALNKSWLEPLSYIGACLGSLLLFLFIYLVLPESQKNSIRECFTAAKRKLCCCCPCSNKTGGCYLWNKGVLLKKRCLIEEGFAGSHDQVFVFFCLHNLRNHTFLYIAFFTTATVIGYTDMIVRTGQKYWNPVRFLWIKNKITTGSGQDNN